jgi:predicted DNA-binding transcriptional regulator AlpA
VIAADPNLELLTLKEVEQWLKVSRSWVYKQMAGGKFPRPIKRSHKFARWRRAELLVWLTDEGTSPDDG